MTVAASGTNDATLKAAKEESLKARAAALAAAEAAWKSKEVRTSGEPILVFLAKAQAAHISGYEFYDLIDEQLAVEKNDRANVDTFIDSVAPRIVHGCIAELARFLHVHGTQPRGKQKFMLTLRSWC